MLAVTANATLSGYAMYRLDGSVCYLDDIFGAEGEIHISQVAASLLRHLRELGGVTTISVSINDDPHGFPWRRFGFMRRRDYQRVMRSPDNTREAGASWHLTAGDKDV